MKNISFWTDEELHEDDSQQKRQESALDKKLTPIEIDIEKQMCAIKGSGKVAYKVSLQKCTCGDFLKRRLPCKHMYRLAHEVNIFQLDGEIQVSKIIPHSNVDGLDIFIDIEQGEILKYASLETIKGNIDVLSTEDLSRLNNRYQHLSCSVNEKGLAATFDKNIAKFLVDVGMYIYVNVPVIEMPSILDREYLLKMIESIDPKKTKNINRRSTVKTFIKILSGDLLEDFKLVSKDLTILALTPIALEKIKTINRHMVKQYINTALCRACYQKSYSVKLSDIDYIDTDIWGCIECGKNYQIAVHKSKFKGGQTTQTTDEITFTISLK